MNVANRGTNRPLARSLLYSAATPGLKKISPIRLISTIIALAFTFYAGVMTGMNTSISQHHDCNLSQKSTMVERNQPDQEKCQCNDEDEIEARVEERVKEEMAKSISEADKNPKSVQEESNTQKGTDEEKAKCDTSSYQRFSPGMGMFATGAAFTKKEEFMKTFDYGYPLDNFGRNSESDVLMLYNSASVPWSISEASPADGLPYIKDPLEATAQCQQMNVVLSNSACLAIMWQYESFHVQRWIRTKKDPSVLTPVGRGRDSRGGDGDQFSPPSIENTQKHWKMLRDYLESVEELVNNLRPITEKIKRENTIIVMVCNHGQSPLLLNFACSCRARGLDISNILLFATDRQTLELAESLGMTAYFDEKNFGNLPNQAARSYGDRTFQAMMYAKVVSVQIINYMGYDVLFQDVDLHWYRNPLELFHNKSSPLSKFDMMFQDDGARSLRYTPYSANSGFYYVRYNDRTRYLFICLLMQSDMIVKHSSHQQVLISLLAEHSSLTGLRVKVLDKDTFPGGFDYHRRGRWDSLRKIQRGELKAEIFHMSWTENKDNKLLFMKQMGMWHLKDECTMKTLDDIRPLTENHDEDSPTLEDGDRDTSDNLGNDEAKDATAKLDIFNACCSVEPLVTCHYSDKPSIINCNEQKPIDKGGSPFWQEDKK